MTPTLVTNPQRAMPFWVIPLLVAAMVMFGINYQGHHSPTGITNLVTLFIGVVSVVVTGYFFERACRGRTLRPMIAILLTGWLGLRIGVMLWAIVFSSVITIVIVFNDNDPARWATGLRWLFLYMPAFVAFGFVGNAADSVRFTWRPSSGDYAILGLFAGVIIATLLWGLSFNSAITQSDRRNAEVVHEQRILRSAHDERQKQQIGSLTAEISRLNKVKMTKVMRNYFPIGSCQREDASGSVVSENREGRSDNLVNLVTEFLSATYLSAPNGQTIGMIEIIGYADQTGEFTANNRLSECRAQTSRNIVVDAKADGRIISVRGAGSVTTSTCAASIQNPIGSLAHCRRADIVLHLQ